MGGPSFPGGLTSLSIAKTLFYFHDLTECLENHPLARRHLSPSPMHSHLKATMGKGGETSSFLSSSLPPGPNKPPKDGRVILSLAQAS